MYDFLLICGCICMMVATYVRFSKTKPVIPRPSENASKSQVDPKEPDWGRLLGVGVRRVGVILPVMVGKGVALGDCEGLGVRAVIV